MNGVASLGIAPTGLNLEWALPVLIFLAIGALVAIPAIRALATRLSKVPADYHNVVRVVACLLPGSRARDWAEEMQGQLAELAKIQRRKMLTNILRSAPDLWATTWLLHRRLSRALTLHGRTLGLVQQLRTALDPTLRNPSGLLAVPDRFVMLRSLGLSRTLRWPTRTVPALRLARRLVDTRAASLQSARLIARQLLDTREQAHLIVRDMRRDHHATWIRPNYQSESQLADRRAQAIEFASKLRVELDHFVGSDHSPAVLRGTQLPLAGSE